GGARARLRRDRPTACSDEGTGPSRAHTWKARSTWPQRPPPAPPDRIRSSPTGLRCRIRLADGRLFAGELVPERHRALQIAMLHRLTRGLVELAAGTRRDGRLLMQTRRRADHFLPGGAAGEQGWLEALLEL